MIAQTTKQDRKIIVNKAGATVADATDAPRTPQQEAIVSDEDLELPGISVVEQQEATERLEVQTTVSPSRQGFLIRFATQLNRLYAWITGPNVAERERREATMVWATTRSKSERFHL